MANRFRLEGFREGHYRLIDPKGDGSAYLTGPAFTGFLGDQIVGCAGIAPISPGVGQAWAIFTDTFRLHPILHRAVVFKFREICQSLPFRRIQADVIEDFLAGRRWAQRLGFRFESRMLKYGPDGEAFIRYVLFPEF